MVELQVALTCMGTHARIGLIAHMPIAQARRIYGPVRAGLMFVDHLLHKGLSRRAPAYIAEADEEHTFLVAVFQLVDQRTVARRNIIYHHFSAL